MSDQLDIADEVWFVRHKPRRYRVRTTSDGQAYLAVRKFNGGFLLRAHLGANLPEGLDPHSESDCEALWWATAYPGTDPRLRRAAMRRSRRNGGAS